MVLVAPCPYCPEFSCEFGKLPLLDGPAQAPHQIEIVIKVVPGIEARAEDFVHFLQMMQIRAREMAAGVTAARLVERADVFAVLRVPQLERAHARVNPAVARIARWQHAI